MNKKIYQVSFDSGIKLHVEAEARDAAWDIAYDALGKRLGEPTGVSYTPLPPTSVIHITQTSKKGKYRWVVTEV